MPDTPARRVLLVCSQGGHLLEMLCLEPAWRGFDITWVTLPGADVNSLLADERVILAHGPTNRSVPALLRNLPLTWRVIRRERPSAILCTGAALAVPFFLLGRIAGCQLVYVESLTRTASLSLSGRIVYPLADRFFVQWPGLSARFRKAEFAGSVLDS